MIISIPISEIFDEIKMNSYYSGESRKLDIPGVFVIQASDDDLMGMQGFIGTAANNCGGFLQIIGPTEHTYTLDIIEYVVNVENCNLHILPLLRKSIVDYIVYFTLYMWMGTVRPELRSIYEEFYTKSAVNINKYCSMIGKKPVRRRSTNLAGI